MLKAGDSICVNMVSAHKESAEVVALYVAVSDI